MQIASFKLFKINYFMSFFNRLKTCITHFNQNQQNHNFQIDPFQILKVKRKNA
jgi:hypothetical protein